MENAVTGTVRRKGGGGMDKSKAVKAVLTAVCILCFGLRADALDRQGGETGSNTDDMEVTQIDDGHTVTVMDGGSCVTETIRTKDNQRIVMQIGDDITEYYEDFSAGIGVTILNGRVIEVHDMAEFAEETDFYWERFDMDKVIWGLAAVIGAAALAGGIWSLIPTRK